MVSPNIAIAVEPFVGGGVVHAPLAPPSSGAEPQAQLSLSLRITNNEANALVANAVALSFILPPLVNPKVIPINLGLPAAQPTTWFFATADNVILPFPAPPALTISLWCNGFSSPATAMLALAAHVNPVSGSAYLFPARSEDLREGEYWQGRSAVHAPAGGGWQLFAYDLGVVAYNPSSGDWSDLLPGGSSGKNEDYRAWGKPIYAMADGTVASFDNDVPTNPAPPADLSPPLNFAGSHFYIDHGTERVLYAHFQPGTLNPSLLAKGSAVNTATSSDWPATRETPRRRISTSMRIGRPRAPPAHCCFGTRTSSIDRSCIRRAHSGLGSSFKHRRSVGDQPDLARRDTDSLVAPAPYPPGHRSTRSAPVQRGVRGPDEAESAAPRRDSPAAGGPCRHAATARARQSHGSVAVPWTNCRRAAAAVGRARCGAQGTRAGAGALRRGRDRQCR
jgi:hypothetical protein